ncbi:MAG: F0F1 ATP synthase subunit A [Chloroflexi bacterium]|nr:F0F1 ATP synthase subunit A [Chloroflexota bacterium]
MPQERSRLPVPVVVVVVLGLLVSGFLFVRSPQPPHVEVAAERLFTIGSFPITNTILTAWIVVLFLVVLFRLATRTMRLVPTGLQNLAEALVEALLNFCVGVAGDKNGRRFFALVGTIFLFVLTSNWMGLLPGVGTIGLWMEKDHHEVLAPLFRSASTDLNMTLTLALYSVIATQIFGARTLGIRQYASKYINLKGGFIGFYVGLLEFLAEVAKLISFSFRLFGNIFAGEILLGVVSFLVPFVAAIPFYGLEVFVGFVQALVFAALTLIFMTIAVSGHGEEHHAGEHESAPHAAQVEAAASH